MISQRQEKILNLLIKEYIDSAEPISSDLLSRLLRSNRGPAMQSGKKRVDLDISPATIRNELQELTELGYVMQPHTSAGRVPTKKGYKYFVEITFSQQEVPDFKNEISQAREKIGKELELAKNLTKSLQQLSTTLSYTKIQSKDTVFEMLKIIGPSQASYGKHIDLMNKLIEELENF